MAKVKQNPISADEPALWEEHLKVLKAGLDAGQPGSIKAAKAEVDRLDQKISALANRREMAAQAARRMARHGAKCVVIERNLLAQIQAEAAKMADVKKLLKGLKRVEKPNSEGATAELASKPARVDPIEWLERYEAEHPGQGLTHEQARAAKEIAAVSEAITRAGQAKIGNMQGNGGGSGVYREPEMPPSLADAHTMRYLPWADFLHTNTPITLDICIKVSVMGVSLNALARKYKKRRSWVLEQLQNGLGRYWDERALLPLYLAKVAASKAAWEQRTTTS